MGGILPPFPSAWKQPPVARPIAPAERPWSSERMPDSSPTLIGNSSLFYLFNGLLAVDAVPVNVPDDRIEACRAHKAALGAAFGVEVLMHPDAVGQVEPCRERIGVENDVEVHPFAAIAGPRGTAPGFPDAGSDQISFERLQMMANH